ncbi:OFA family oxalate/formate antiporter-like MFS transporter [Ruminiclostridium sufflavum DSM 19573]|uniref:OFA family oxalate/formate antiporter-like MFS transporter n=1 Tax=Ruminiclostridium sufflavum DSM 19573 TaxID=1121337 RepID=A0A318XPB8_9FIRM|nr:OFA family MFS transporter [Ruminiclostridium sufflavum]PYG89734.1 OFA family oxalate/formate antiporter-like MFS transporter [Ruminiclostridium sufflavum DSM 19573]
MDTKVKNRYGVLISGMMIQLCAGIIYMWSVFKGPVAQYLEWDPAQAALTSSIMLAVFVFGIIAGGRAQDKIGPKLVTVAGSILISLGMILTAFITKQAPWLVYITYGIIGGLGVGTVYTATVSVIQKWFPDKRGFATGFMVAAFGFSLVIFAPVTNSLLSETSVPSTFIIFGIIFLVVCVLCSLNIDNPTADYAPAGFVTSKNHASKKQYTTSEMLRTRQFYLITLSLLCILPAYFILNPLFITLGGERGLSKELAVLGVMITGIASAAGRLVTSWVSDLIGRKCAVFGIIIITMVSILAMIIAHGVMFLVCIAAIAFSFGGAAGVYPAITADNFGTKHMGLNYGCVMVGFGISALVFPIVSSMLVKSGVYTLSFLVAAATCVIAFVLVLLQKNPE